MKKIVHIINQLFIWITLVVVLFALISFAYLLRYQEKSTQAYNEQLTANVATSVQGEIDTLLQACHFFSYNAVLQEFLLADTPKERFNVSKPLQELSSLLGNMNPNLFSVMTYSAKGEVNNFINSPPYKFYQNNPAFSRLFDMKGKKDFQFIYVEPTTDIPYLVLSMPVFSSNVEAQYLQHIGRVIFFCTMESIEEKLVHNEISRWYMTITDSFNQTFSFREMEKSSTLPYLHHAIPQTDLLLSVHIITSEGKQIYLYMAYILCGLCAIMLLFLFIIRVQFHRRLLRPVTNITNQMAREEMYKPITLSKRTKPCYEIAFLVEKINQMLERDQTGSKQLLDAKSALHQAEIKALESQINPHFLYNTLQCIRGLVFENKVNEVAELALDLATIFRYSIKSPQFVRLADEITIIQKYLHIFAIRWDDRIKYTVEIPKELMEIPMPKMILQPLVENAITHGLEKKLQNATLFVTARMEKEEIYLSVKDNGMGIEKEQLILLQNSLQYGVPFQEGEVHIGLLNIHSRVQYICGKSYGVRLYSSEEGTEVVVHMKFPLNDQGMQAF